MEISFGKAIEFIKDHPEFCMKLAMWKDKYIKWDWSSYSEVNAVPIRLVLVEKDKEPVEWLPNTPALLNNNWIVCTY